MFHGRLDCSEMLINEGANTALAARIQESPADSVSGKSYVKMPLFLFSAKIYNDHIFCFFFLVHWKLRFQTIRIQCPIIEKKNRDQNIARLICSFTI